MKKNRRENMNTTKTRILDFNFIDCLYFFTKYDCRSNYKNVVLYHFNDNVSEATQKKFFEVIKNHEHEIRDIIKKNGFKFYTTDDDDESKCHGWYLKNWHDGTKTVDFEPKDNLTESDLGHVKMYYKNCHYLAIKEGKFQQL